MLVTRIEEFKKGRYRVYLDGEFAFVLYFSELRTYHIKEDTILDTDVYDEIMGRVLVKRARLRAMNLLIKRNYTEKQLRDKLSEGEYPAEIIDNALEYVLSFGYIDDREYARNFLLNHSENKSIARIKSDLSAKGIDRGIIEEVLTEATQNGQPVDEEAQILKLLAKKKYNPDTASFEEKQKIYAFLCRKGFAVSTIKRSIQLLDITSD